MATILFRPQYVKNSGLVWQTPPSSHLLWKTDSALFVQCSTLYRGLLSKQNDSSLMTKLAFTHLVNFINLKCVGYDARSTAQRRMANRSRNVSCRSHNDSRYSVWNRYAASNVYDESTERCILLAISKNIILLSTRNIIFTSFNEQKTHDNAICLYRTVLYSRNVIG